MEEVLIISVLIISGHINFKEKVNFCHSGSELTKYIVKFIMNPERLTLDDLFRSNKNSEVGSRVK